MCPQSLTSQGAERFVDLGPAHSPELFAIVAEHLAGYEVVPVQRAPLPMSIDQVTRNLLVMARFLDLPRLEAALERAIDPPAPAAFEVRMDPAPWTMRSPAEAPDGQRMVRVRLRRVVGRCARGHERLSNDEPVFTPTTSVTTTDFRLMAISR